MNSWCPGLPCLPLHANSIPRYGRCDTSSNTTPSLPRHSDTVNETDQRPRPRQPLGRPVPFATPPTRAQVAHRKRTERIRRAAPQRMGRRIDPARPVSIQHPSPDLAETCWTAEILNDSESTHDHTEDIDVSTVASSLTTRRTNSLRVRERVSTKLGASVSVRVPVPLVRASRAPSTINCPRGLLFRLFRCHQGETYQRSLPESDSQGSRLSGRPLAEARTSPPAGI